MFTSTIHSNAATYGGGAYVSGTGTLNLTATAVVTYAASTSGGGAYVSAGTLNTLNSTVSGNTATASGGGVYVAGGTVKPGLTTITNNQFTRGGRVVRGRRHDDADGSIIARNPTGTDTWGGDVKLVTGATITGGGGDLVGAGDTAAFTAAQDQPNITDEAQVGLGALQTNGAASAADHRPRRSIRVPVR